MHDICETTISNKCRGNQNKFIRTGVLLPRTKNERVNRSKFIDSSTRFTRRLYVVRVVREERSLLTNNLKTCCFLSGLVGRRNCRRGVGSKSSRRVFFDHDTPPPRLEKARRWACTPSKHTVIAKT